MMNNFKIHSLTYSQLNKKIVAKRYSLDVMYRTIMQLTSFRDLVGNEIVVGLSLLGAKLDMDQNRLYQFLGRALIDEVLFIIGMD